MNNPSLYASAPNYYLYYFDLVESNELIAELKKNRAEVVAFLEAIPDNRWDFAYEQDKWTAAQVIRHIIETERIFAYRSLRFSRFDSTPLAGFNENQYIDNLKTIPFTRSGLINEFKTVRDSTISLFESMTSDMLAFLGEAYGLPVSAEMLGFMIVGHTAHHVSIIETRYLD